MTNSESMRGECACESEIDDVLDRAELALRRSYGRRRESETSFLQHMLRDLGSPAYRAGLSPAQLFRAAVRDGGLMLGVQSVLKVVALPCARPDDALRVGDWILRLVPGTGDVGHVSVLTSDDLLTLSGLRAEGIAAESTQSGFYGTVIEGGAFPHTRNEPFARRVLDGRGRVPPNTLILRPRGEGLPGEMEETDGPDPGAYNRMTRTPPKQPSRCVGITTLYEQRTYQLFLKTVKSWIRTCVEEGRENELLDNNASLISVWNELISKQTSGILGSLGSESIFKFQTAAKRGFAGNRALQARSCRRKNR
jgi:hypothetical protein